VSQDEAAPIRLIEETYHLISASFKEVVPPEAQLHFLNAQRELLLGIAAVIEHNSQRRIGAPRRTKARSGATRKPRRPAKVELD
jgi:hypothetical protein